MRLRAERRLGEITREMEKAQGKRVDTSPREGEKSKADALKTAGIETQDAYRYERIAAIPERRFEAEVVKPEAATRGLARPQTCCGRGRSRSSVRAKYRGRSRKLQQSMRTSMRLAS